LSKKQTAGQIATELYNKNKFGEIENAIDVQRATEQDYLKDLFWAINHNFKTVECTEKCKSYCSTREPIKDKDFYVVVLTKKEPALANLFRNYFITATCAPTPTYDQTVWKFNQKTQNIELLWTVPNKEDCIMYKQNAAIVDPEEHQLLKYVLDFYDGTLDKLAVTLNKETNTGIVLYKKEPKNDLII
jgi:hypothetical protein